MSYLLSEWKWNEVAAYLSRRDLILFPVGSTEQHGRHLPLMTDSAWAVDVAEAVAEREKVLVSPPLFFGWTPHHLSYPGTITLRPDTLTRVITDVGQSLVYHGFKKILILNGHRVANLPPLEIAASRLRNTTQALVAVLDLALIAVEEVRQICESEIGGFGHADEIESSFMLYRHPELVDMSQAGKNVPPRKSRFSPSLTNLDRALDGNRYGNYPTIEEWRRSTAPQGFKGDPSLGSAEKGRRIFEAIVNNAIEVLRELEEIQIGEVRKEAPI